MEKLTRMRRTSNTRKGVNEEEDKVILRLMQTGSNWTKELAQQTGKEDDGACTLCGAKETKDHVWHCGRLKCKRKEIDEHLADADPDDFTPAMRMGVACAMSADIRKTFWGTSCDGNWSPQKRKRCGCVKPERSTMM